MTLRDLESVLERIQAEPLETVRSRQKAAFDQIAGPHRDKLILFGAGPLGRDTLRGLRKAGVEPLAFADNNRRLWGAEVNGLPVLSASDAAKRFAESACFVVTIYNGSAARLQLSQLGCQRVAHFVPLYWKFSEVFLPHSGIDLPERLRDQLADVQMCYSILADDESRRQIVEQLSWRCWLDQNVLSGHDNPRDTYFPFDLLVPTPVEVFVDCGSFEGETILSFSAHWSGQFRHIFAFEPDAKNCARLRANVVSMGINNKVTIVESALGALDGRLGFASMGSVTSHVMKSDATEEVQCCRLDDVRWAEFAPTYIKMDVESAEPDVLNGAAEIMRRHQPALAVCTYHRSEHLWRIPILIHALAPEYRLFIRRYAEDCWETVCYAVPQHRLCPRC
ncbi:MAG: FkbM family methyltransferase [Terriglobales bacterium]